MLDASGNKLKHLQASFTLGRLFGIVFFTLENYTYKWMELFNFIWFIPILSVNVVSLIKCFLGLNVNMGRAIKTATWINVNNNLFSMFANLIYHIVYRNKFKKIISEVFTESIYSKSKNKSSNKLTFIVVAVLVSNYLCETIATYFIYKQIDFFNVTYMAYWSSLYVGLVEYLIIYQVFGKLNQHFVDLNEQFSCQLNLIIDLEDKRKVNSYLVNLSGILDRHLKMINLANKSFDIFKIPLSIMLQSNMTLLVQVLYTIIDYFRYKTDIYGATIVCAYSCTFIFVNMVFLVKCFDDITKTVSIKIQVLLY